MYLRRTALELTLAHAWINWLTSAKDGAKLHLNLNKQETSMFRFQNQAETELEEVYRLLNQSEDLTVAEYEELTYRANYLEQELDREEEFA